MNVITRKCQVCGNKGMVEAWDAGVSPSELEPR